eukprot:gene4715-6619_t
MNSSGNNLLNNAEGNQSQQRDVSESAFEYLLGEIMSLTVPVAQTNDQSTAINQRLDQMGYEVGYRIIERISANQKYIGSEPLDLVKFICKEFWEEVFKKKVDKLQTNHRGVFVLSDVRFRWLEKYSSDDIASKQAATKLLFFPCGMLRGALANLGVLTIVNADFNNLPACTFNIRMKT